MKQRAALVAVLRERGAIRSAEVAAAFEHVPRERFVPAIQTEHGLDGVYRDEAFVTKRDPHGMPVSSSSQPAVMAAMLELLQLRPGQRVLEVGAGTGYNAAIIRRMVGAAGAVTTIDVDSELARAARLALRRAGYKASVVTGDGRSGWPERAPYDRIIVTACADWIPRPWLQQLVDGGRLVLPLRLDPDGAAPQLIPAFVRQGARLRSARMTWGSFMALHGGDGGWRPPLAQASATRSTAGKPRSLGSISGGGLVGVSQRVAASLLADLVAGRGIRRAQGRTPMGSRQLPLMLVYLLHAIPDRRRVSVQSEHRIGIGVLDRRSASLAVLSMPSPWSSENSPASGSARWRLDAYGGDGAAVEFEQVLAGWRELQRGVVGSAVEPGLQITAYGQGEVLRLRWRWGA